MKVLIVGGVAAGASTAARLRRLDENAEIIIFERGGEVSYSNCGLPYYIGGVIADPDELLLQTPESLWARFRIDVRTFSEVTSIDRNTKTVEVRKTTTGECYTESYDKLVLAPGAEAILPPVPGADLPGVCTLRTVTDTMRIHELVRLQNCHHVVVVGGGFIGLEMVENLRNDQVDVTLVQHSAQVFPPFDPEMAAIIQKELEANHVSVEMNTTVEKIEADNGRYRVKCSKGGEERELLCDLVVVAIGVRPESGLAVAAGLKANTKGGILVDEYLRTEDEDIYAGGDVIEVKNQVSGKKMQLPMAGPANRQGRIIAANLAGGKETFDGVIGSCVCKIFRQTAACTGLNEKTLIAQGIAYEKVYLSPAQHVGVYPGASPLTMKLLFAPDGRVLGCQCIGTDGVEKRVDVAASVIHFHGTVHDLASLELCYAPPYSSAKDPINFAGFLAENALSGRSPLIHWSDLAARPTDAVLIDVRTPREYAAGHLKGSINIPVDEIRQRLAEIPENRPLWIYCQVGLRGYVAQRMLMQLRPRQKVFNLSGGYRLIKIAGLIPEQLCRE